MGPTGATGGAGASTNGLLKFSGLVTIDTFTPKDTYLADAGFDGNPSDGDPLYRIPLPCKIQNMTADLLDPLKPGMVLVIEILRNSIAIAPPFKISYNGTSPTSGPQLLVVGPAPFLAGDSLSVRVQTSTTGQVSGQARLSVAVGIAP